MVLLRWRGLLVLLRVRRSGLLVLLFISLGQTGVTQDQVSPAGGSGYLTLPASISPGRNPLGLVLIFSTPNLCNSHQQKESQSPAIVHPGTISVRSGYFPCLVGCVVIHTGETSATSTFSPVGSQSSKGMRMDVCMHVCLQKKKRVKTKTNPNLQQQRG